MLQFSIVVPFVGEESAFDDTLASVLRTRPPRAEVLVIHAGEYHDPYGLRGEVDFLRITSSRLIACWNAAVDRARGEVLVWLMPGMELDDGWEVDCWSGFIDPDVGSVIPMVIRGGGRPVLGSVSVRSDGTRLAEDLAAWRVGPTIQAGAYRQTALGWLESLDLEWDDAYLDAYLGLALNRLGYRTQVAADWMLLGKPAKNESSKGLAHGRSAARAVNCFGVPLRAGGLPGWVRAGVAGFANRSHWLHAWQRLGAFRFLSQDRSTLKKLTAARQQRIELAERVSPLRRAA